MDGFMATSIFLGLIALVRLLIAIALLQMAVRQNLPNLRWLAFGFLATVIGIPFAAQPYIPFVDKTISYFAYLSFAIFIHKTFYQGRRSPFAVFWTIFTLLYVAILWTTNSFLSELTGTSFPANLFIARPPAVGEPGGVGMVASEIIDAVIYGCLQLAIWLWHALAAFKAYKPVSDDTKVEDWVKGRYRLMIAYSVLQSLVGVVMIVRPFVSGAALDYVIYGSALLVMSTTIMQYLVWAMPGGFREWLNRKNSGGRVQDEPITQQQIFMLNEIAESMCYNSGLTLMRSGFVLRRALGEMIGSEDGEKIEAYAGKMSFEQWMALLSDQKLSKQIAALSSSEVSEMALERARYALVKKQSVITMQAR
jgi:hypothetical protein